MSPASAMSPEGQQKQEQDATKEAVRLATMRAAGLKCAIDGGLLRDGVTLFETGQTFNRPALASYLKYLRENRLPLTCPSTRKTIGRDAQVVTNFAIKAAVDAFVAEFEGKEGPEWAEIRQLCEDYKAEEAEALASNAPMSPVCTAAYDDGFEPEPERQQRPTHPGSPRRSIHYGPEPQSPYSPYSPTGPAYSPTSPNYDPRSPVHSDDDEPVVRSPIYSGTWS